MEVLVRGIGASPGIIKGKVKILLSSAEMDKFKEGEILVASTTSPLYTLAILKASAIVTDRGGVLCHSAIVAREQGIPCVVGTEKATQALKDGMEVTVDGKEGIIYK